MNEVYKHPSFYAHALNGILLLLAIYILVANFGEIRTVGSYKLIVIILLFSAVVGIHGISHLGMEKIYKYPFVSL